MKIASATKIKYLLKSAHKKAKTNLHAIYEAGSRADAEAACDRFLAKYKAKYDKAAHCLAMDRGAFLAFYDFPRRALEAHPVVNPIESAFATVRRRRQGQGLPLA